MPASPDAPASPDSPGAPGSHAALLQAARRQIVLDAARRTFERDGLENTTLRSIAREAGCTTGAIYPWFNGKEALYAELLEDSLERLRLHLEARLDSASPRVAARRVIEGFFAYYAERPAEFSLGLYLYRGVAPRGLGADLDQRLNARLARCVDLIGAALGRTGVIGDASVPVTQMNAFTYLMGLLLLLHTGRLKSLGQRAETLLDAYCTTLETPP
jgi:TetR/AcrR family transcriptional regulator